MDCSAIFSTSPNNTNPYSQTIPSSIVKRSYQKCSDMQTS